MGLYDREYVRDEHRGFFLGGDRTMVTNLLLVNGVVYLADLLFEGRISEALKLRPDLFQHPWNAWQLITFGFLHDPHDITHVLFNMFGLWLFGRDVEGIYGRREFLRFYLVAIVASGIVWAAGQSWLGVRSSGCLGASGAVTAVMVLFTMHYPRRTFMLWGVLPLPAWLICILYVAQDLRGLGGQMGAGGVRTAFEAHLAGAAFAVLYRASRVNLGRLVPSRWRMGRRGAPPLRVHHPELHEEDLGTQVDRILEKISREGEASLTPQERRTLETASRRYQQRRR